jgi:hypothetical protein
VKIAAGQLRRLIREELASEPRVEPDPFRDPNKKAAPAKPDLKSFSQNVVKAEELLCDMPKVLSQLSDTTKNLKARNLLKKGAGLAYHAENDLKALEAILVIAVKEMRRN